MAVIGSIWGILTLLLGQAASLNHFLDSTSGLNIFGSPIGQSDVNPVVMMGVFHNFYPGVIPLVIITAVVLLLVAIYGALSFLSMVGRFLMNFMLSFTDSQSAQAVLLTVLIVWSATIVIIWALLNINDTVIYLLAACGLMLVDLVLFSLSKAWRVDDDADET